jgi:hypothetical protein
MQVNTSKLVKSLFEKGLTKTNIIFICYKRKQGKTIFSNILLGKILC